VAHSANSSAARSAPLKYGASRQAVTDHSRSSVSPAFFALRSRSDAEAVDNLGGWLTTVVARVALNMVRSRSTRRETPLERLGPDPAVDADPEHETVLAGSVGQALLVVLDTLTPAERLAFVLHDMFAVPFTDIASIMDRSPAAARQLASRARRRVQGVTPGADQDAARTRRIVEAFLAASRTGDLQTLLSLLDPDVVVRADQAAVLLGAADVRRGASTVAEGFNGRALGARLALLDSTRAPSGHPTTGRWSPSPSRSWTTRSPRSNCWQIPRYWPRPRSRSWNVSIRVPTPARRPPRCAALRGRPAP
jgi:RNA polymerase sigma-70 factor, ECF subfamily